MKRLDRMRRGRLPLALAITCGAVVAQVAGCNIVAPAAYILGGLPKVDAVYVLPVDEKKYPLKVTVYTDDSNSVIPTNSRAVCLAVSDQVTGELIDRDCVPASLMLNARDAMGVVSRRDSYSDPLSVVGIARAVEADVIIYVDMTSFRLTNDGEFMPTASGNVRVTDATNNDRLFPPDEDGTGTAVWPVSVRLDLRGLDTAVTRSRAGRTQLNEALAIELGTEIAKMFYRHESQELGDRLDG